MSDQEIYKLNSVSVRDFLRVEFAELDFTDDIVVIGGENGAGKSSVARALLVAFCGKEAVPADPVRHGAEESEIVVELDGDLVIHATVKPDRTYKLELRDKAGGVYRRGQERLNAFNFHYCYAPEEFIRAKPKEQLEILLRVMGIDFDPIDRERNKLFADRTEISRARASAEGKRNSLTWHDDVPEVEQQFGSIISDIDDAHAVERQQAELRRKAAFNRQMEVEALADIEAKLREIEALKGKAAEHAELARLAEIQAEAMVLPDVSALKDQLRMVEQINAKIRETNAAKQAQAEWDELETTYSELTKQIAEIDARKAQMLSDAKFPIDGLGFDDEGVMLNGVPFAQGSDAQKWAAAVAIGFALKPKLKLVYVREGSLMTPRTRRMVYDLVREKGAQLLFEIAGDADDVSVIMEDGVSKPKAARVPEVREHGDSPPAS